MQSYNLFGYQIFTYFRGTVKYEICQIWLFIIDTDQAQINSATLESVVHFLYSTVQYMWYISGGQFVHFLMGEGLPNYANDSFLCWPSCPPPFHWPFLYMNRNDIDTRNWPFFCTYQRSTVAIHNMNIRCWSKQELIEIWRRWLIFYFPRGRGVMYRTAWPHPLLHSLFLMDD